MSIEPSPYSTNRLIEIDPPTDGSEIGCRQTARHDLARLRPHCDRSGVGQALAAAVDLAHLIRTSFGKPSFGAIHTTIRNPVSRGGSFRDRPLPTASQLLWAFLEHLL